MQWQLALFLLAGLVLTVAVLALVLPKYRKNVGQGHFHEPVDWPAGVNYQYVLFSSEFCSQCPATRRVLETISKSSEEIAWTEISLSESYELSEKYHILRTPTVFLLDREQQIITRFSGKTPHHILEEPLNQIQEMSSYVN